ncbi:unnamed protein product [Thelazia callipaeda]|uniref:Saposin B-type domain-containing protein n=1 Tax=Thelazia callipaeda TaxID=103827 RepID=A0A0N5DC21_THECL|nr:unnamed protein product [Thelazia callipaeda]
MYFSFLFLSLCIIGFVPIEGVSRVHSVQREMIDSNQNVMQIEKRALIFENNNIAIGTADPCSLCSDFFDYAKDFLNRAAAFFSNGATLHECESRFAPYTVSHPVCEHALSLLARFSSYVGHEINSTIICQTVKACV